MNQRTPPPPLAIVVAALQAHRAELTAAGAEHVSIFGSVARGTEGPGSDVDIAIDLAADKDLFDLADLAGTVSRILQTSVDLASRSKVTSGDMGMSTDRLIDRLSDMLGNIQRIRRHVSGMDRDAFLRDEKTRDAVKRCLERIAEPGRWPGTW